MKSKSPKLASNNVNLHHRPDLAHSRRSGYPKSLTKNLKGTAEEALADALNLLLMQLQPQNACRYVGLAEPSKGLAWLTSSFFIFIKRGVVALICMALSHIFWDKLLCRFLFFAEIWTSAGVCCCHLHALALISRIPLCYKPLYINSRKTTALTHRGWDCGHQVTQRLWVMLCLGFRAHH